MARTLRMSGRALALAATAALIVNPAFARSAGSLNDLVGARGSSGESQMESRGFTFITSHQGKHDNIHGYWWNARDKNCVNVETREGRYYAITDATPSDCNQKSGSGSAAAVAGVAIGVALIAALASHKSDHHDDGRHYSDSAREDQYERGFNDGLHNTSYHNYDRNDAYSSGYQAGVDQRRINTSYHAGRGGYASHARVNDLKNRDSVWAVDEMSARGFRGVDAFSSGNTTYAVYYNPSTSQCVQLTNADNRVYDARDIGTHPKCR